MINILQNLNIGGLLALVAGVVLMVSWKAVDSKKAVAQWYQITITDLSNPNDEANQQIDGLYPGGAPTFPCTENSGHKCAVLMDIGSNPLPSTVAEARSQGIAEEDSAFTNP